MTSNIIIVIAILLVPRLMVLLSADLSFFLYLAPFFYVMELAFY